LNDARAKARDARRKSDIHQFQLALEYYLDTNGIYPASGGASPSPNGPNSSWSNSAEASSWGSGSLQTAMAPYLSKLPTDPTNSPIGPFVINAYYYFRFSSEGGCSSQYMMVYKLEKGASVVSPGYLTCGGTTYQYSGGPLNSANANGIITIGRRGL